jgi:hypothetical protein
MMDLIIGGTFEFLISMVICHDVLFAINKVSKKLQSLAMYIDSTLDLIQCMMEYFETYRNEGFSNCLNIAKGIAIDMGVHPSFQVNRHVVRKKQFDENNSHEEILEVERAFKVKYLLVMVDMAITSLKTRFEELMVFKCLFGFLLSSNKVIE